MTVCEHEARARRLANIEPLEPCRDCYDERKQDCQYLVLILMREIVLRIFLFNTPKVYKFDDNYRENGGSEE